MLNSYSKDVFLKRGNVLTTLLRGLSAIWSCCALSFSLSLSAYYTRKQKPKLYWTCAYKESGICVNKLQPLCDIWKSKIHAILPNLTLVGIWAEFLIPGSLAAASGIPCKVEKNPELGLMWSYMILISSAMPSFLLICWLWERGGAGN